MIEAFNRATTTELRNRLNEVLAEAGIEGVTFQVGGMSFTDTECKIQLKAETAGNTEKKLGNVGHMAALHGVAKLEADGWRLVDYHARKPKYPFIALNPAGKRYKLTVAQTKNRFGAA